MLSYLSTALLALAVPALSAPTPQSWTNYYCDTDYVYKNVVSATPYLGNWELYGGTVNSNSAAASLSATWSDSYSFTIDVGASFNINFPEELGNAGVTTSVSWTWGNTSGISDTVPCPAGGYTCGLVGRPSWTVITGTRYGIYVGNDCPQMVNGEVPNTEINFSFVTVETANLQSGNTTTLMQWGACVCKSSGNQTFQANLGPCPSNC